MTTEEAKTASRPCPFCQHPVAINFEIGSGWQIGCGAAQNACLFRPTSVFRKDIEVLVLWWNGLGKGNKAKAVIKN
jgi:hypothetical protein